MRGAKHSLQITSNTWAHDIISVKEYKTKIMFKNIQKLFVDCFTHLGEVALYKPKDKKQPYLVQILKQQPDKFYEVGDSQFIGEMLFLEVSVFDIFKPMIGDIFVVNDRKYKVHSEPLRDNSSILWKIECIAIGETDA